MNGEKSNDGLAGPGGRIPGRRAMPSSAPAARDVEEAAVDHLAAARRRRVFRSRADDDIGFRRPATQGTSLRRESRSASVPEATLEEDLVHARAAGHGRTSTKKRQRRARAGGRRRLQD